MWQRWQNRQQQQPTISHPTQFTTLDQDQPYDYEDRYLETITEVDSISSRRQSQHVALPELPLYVDRPSHNEADSFSRVVPPMNDLSRNTYSTASPTVANGTNHGLRIIVDPKQDAQLDISPVTPRASSEHRRQDEQPISPIDPIASNSREHLPDRGFQSQIPKRVVSSSKPTTTRWDDYSGEPTDDNRGREASAKPGQPLELQYPQLKQRTQQILAGVRDRNAQKKPAWGKQPPPVAADPLDRPPQREPWRGASGRAAIVEPVKNTLVARVAAPRQPERDLGLANQHNHVSPDTYAQERQLRTKESADSIKPVVPLKTRNLTPPGSAYGQSPRQSPITSPATIAYIPTSKQRQDNRVESPQHDPEPTTPTTPHASPRVQQYVEPASSFVPIIDASREQSRFSWTTYTASTTDSRRTTFNDIHESPTTLPELESPLLIKKRPISSSPFMQSQPYMHSPFADSTGSVIRKPVPGDTPQSRSTSRVLSTSKTLPPTPTITEAADKIENLEAQLDTLNRRKHNANRIVNGLQTSLKKNAVVYDMWKRREVEKNIINHESELAEIGQEIHELSLQLHRAQKKRDREDGYEKPTGLWIKRVTS